MAGDFEKYAEAHYLPAVKKHKTDNALLLAGLRYIKTREITGLESRLREIFTTRYTTKLGRAIDDACLDALLAMAQEPLSNARFLAQVATLPKPLPTSPLAEKALLSQESVAAEALLLELAKPFEAKQQRNLVRLLIRLTHVKPPLPISFWKQENQAERKAVVDRWREGVRAKGFDVAAGASGEQADRILKESASEMAFEKADRLFKRKRYARALEAFQKIARDFHDTHYASQARDRVNAIKSDPRIMAEIRKINSKHQCESRLETARALALQGDTDEAERHYRRIIQNHPNSQCADTARNELAELMP